MSSPFVVSTPLSCITLVQPMPRHLFTLETCSTTRLACPPHHSTFTHNTPVMSHHVPCRSGRWSITSKACHTSASACPPHHSVFTQHTHTHTHTHYVPCRSGRWSITSKLDVGAVHSISGRVSCAINQKLTLSAIARLGTTGIELELGAAQKWVGLQWCLVLGMRVCASKCMVLKIGCGRRCRWVPVARKGCGCKHGHESVLLMG